MENYIRGVDLYGGENSKLRRICRKYSPVEIWWHTV